MTEPPRREPFIPIRSDDLIDLLCADAELTAAERALIRQLGHALTVLFHFEHHRHLRRFKNAYASFDPDRDTQALSVVPDEERRHRLDQLVVELSAILTRANFRRLQREELLSALHAASHWGINMDVDFDVFERLEVFVRGDLLSKRLRRHVWKWWRWQEVLLATYQRLVLLFKLRPHKRLGKGADTAGVYLKFFKDIPKIDVEMLLPGAPKMHRVVQGKLGVSLASSVGMVGYKIASDLGHLAWEFVQRNPLSLWGPLSLVCGYGYRQYYGYQQTRQSYNLRLTQSLYYQNLDNNAGVLTRLVDEAEEQECRETLLAYYFLWRQGGQGCSSHALDEQIERELEQRAGVTVDFEIADALAKLERLGLAHKIGDRYQARPPAEALQRLDWTRGNALKYNTARPEESSLPTPSA